MNQTLLDFYTGNDADTDGRKIEDIWLFDDIALESDHRFIQWLFPLKEPSLFNKNAPLLDDETAQVFRSSPELQERVSRSLDVMLLFLRLKYENGVVSMTSEDLHWLTWKNHNFRRLTRMITSLRLLGLDAPAKALYSGLCDVCNKTERGLVIDVETVEFWRVAAYSELI